MKMKKKTIQKELFLSYSLLIIIVILFCVITFFTVFVKETERRMKEYNVSLCRRLALQIDNEVERMDDIAKRIIFTGEVKDLFYQDFTPAQTEERYKNQLQLAELLNSLTGPAYKVTRINLLAAGRRFISVEGYVSVKEEAPNQDISWDPMGRPSNRLLIAPAGKEGENEKTFSLIRKLAPPLSLRQEAFVEIQQAYSVFDGIINNTRQTISQQENSKAGTSVYVFEEGGRQIYPYPDEERLGKRYQEFALQFAKNTEEPTRVSYGPGSVELFSCVRAENTGWYVVMVDAQRYLDYSAAVYIFGILIGGFFLLAIALLISYLIARRITRPILQVHRNIQSLNPVTLVSSRQKISGSTFNEVEELNFAFQNLCEELIKSADEAALSRTWLLQAKLLALQSQMNPHFLYNTLSAISIMAEEEGAVQSMDMILTLSDMLDYVADGEMRPVEIQEELEYTENFLALLKIRFEDQIQVKIDVPGEMERIRIPRLIIEPLAENWSKYGMNGEERSELTIRGFLSEDRWRITVTDNGSGFSTEALQELDQQIRKVNRKDGRIPDLKIHKMGLLNIYIRLHYAYGDHCIFRVENTVTGSGQITIGGTLE